MPRRGRRPRQPRASPRKKRADPETRATDVEKRVRWKRMTDTDARDKALRLWEEAQRFQMRRELPEAIRLYRESLATLPTAEAHTFLGWALSWQGDVDGAIEECKRAIVVDPEFGNPYNDIGVYLIEKGDLEGA